MTTYIRFFVWHTWWKFKLTMASQISKKQLNKEVCKPISFYLWRINLGVEGAMVNVAGRLGLGCVFFSESEYLWWWETTHYYVWIYLLEIIEAKSLIRLTSALGPFIISDAWCLLRVPPWLKVRASLMTSLFFISFSAAFLGGCNIIVTLQAVIYFSYWCVCVCVL